MKWLPVILVIALLGIGVAIFVRNNFAPTPEPAIQFTSDSVSPDAGSPSSRVSIHHDTLPRKNIKEIVSATPAGISTRYGYPTKLLVCPLRGETSLFAMVQIEYRFNEEALREEIKFKQPDLEAIVQNIVFEAERSELNAPWLRSRLLEVTNQILKNGTIEDIVFRDFRIEIRNGNQ